MTSTLSRRAVLLGSCASALALAGCAARPRLQSIAPILAPTGTLRASINYGNRVLAKRDPAGGEPSGVSVDLARALAGELGVACSFVTFDGAARSVEAVRTGQADIGFFAVDPLRSEGLRFTAPYVLIEGAYLVREGSPLIDNGEVDRPGARVIAAKGSVYDLYLTRALKFAQIVHVSTSDSVVDAMLAQNADVAAGVKQQLEADAARLGAVRLLPGRFMVIGQAMGLPFDRGEPAAQAVANFVERAKAGGLVAAALRRHGIEGAIVAPAA